MSGALKQTSSPLKPGAFIAAVNLDLGSMRPKRLSQVGFCGKPSLNWDLFVWRDSLRQQGFRDFDVHWLDVSEA